MTGPSQVDYIFVIFKLAVNGLVNSELLSKVEMKLFMVNEVLNENINCGR